MSSAKQKTTSKFVKYLAKISKFSKKIVVFYILLYFYIKILIIGMLKI